MTDSRTASGPREAFAQRFALLYSEAGNPPLQRVAEAVSRAQRVDERGLPVRVSAQRISDWRRGRNVPAQLAALTAVLNILIGRSRRLRPVAVADGLYDLSAWQSLWERALASPASPAGPASAAGPDGESPDPAGDGAIRAESPPDGGGCPYRGLAAFREEDSGWYFGREAGISDLVARLGSAPDAGGPFMLVGPSGAGKSSLLRAGLIPALGKGALGMGGSALWPVLLLTPGGDPLTELADRIPDLADVLTTAGPAGRRPAESGTALFADLVRAAVTAWAERSAGPGARLVLIVDQFEETFTLCHDEARRQAFVRALHAASSPASPASPGPAPALVVLGLRADFYSQCLDHPELTDALQHRHIVLGPMTTAELREAVTAPARAGGLQLEPGLVELILRELNVNGGRSRTGGSGAAHEAGVLPLLSHALLATWQHRKAGRLTISGYRAAGGIHGAVAATAESAWLGMDPARRKAARMLLMRLVRVGEDTQDTRRRSTRRELTEQASDPAKTAESLEVLVRARLVTLDAESVEITHEALLYAWPRLRKWIDEDRDRSLSRQRLEEDSNAWDGSGRDSSLLYRGARLEMVQQWAKSADLAEVTDKAWEFLAASARLRRRTVWLTRTGVLAVVVFALVAGVLAVVASRQRDDAVFERVVAEADRVQYTDPSLSAQLDLVAHQLRPGDQGVDDRLLSTQNAPLATPLSGHSGAVYLTTFSPDGHTLASASYDRTVRLWDVRDPIRPKALGIPLTGHTSWVSSAVFSPDGRTLASASDDGTIRLWNVMDPAHPLSLGPAQNGRDGTIYLVAFSPDGHTLASADENHTVQLWDVHDATHPTPLVKLTGHTAAVRCVAFSPDGSVLAAGGDDATVRLWNIKDPRHPAPLGEPLRGHTGTVHSVAFSPDGRTLATGSKDKTVRLWNVTSPAAPASLGAPLIAHTRPVWSVAFSPDGNLLAAGSEDSTASLWSVADPSAVAQVGQTLAGSSGGVFAVGFSPDGHTLATGSGDNMLRLWSLPTTDMLGRLAAFARDARVLATASSGTIQLWNIADRTRPLPLGRPFNPDGGEVHSVALSPGGRLLITRTGEHTVQLWNLTHPAHPVAYSPSLVIGTRYADALALSPDGRILATGADDESIQLWNIADPGHPARLGKPLTGHTGYVNVLVFSPDGRTLASGSADNSIRLWNVTDPGHATVLGSPLTRHRGAVDSLAFSPDGRTLASGSDDNTIRLWNVTDPGHPTPLGTPLTENAESVNSLSFSPDGATLASSSDNDTVMLWKVSDPAEAAPLGQPLTAHAKDGDFVSFDPVGGSLAMSSGSGTIRVLALDTGSAIRRICSTTRNNLTPRVWQQRLRPLPYRPPCADAAGGG